MSAVVELGDLIAKLTLAEAVELKSYLKERYQIEPATVVPVEDVDKPIVINPTPTAFDVILRAIDPTKKIGVIKAVRELTGQGLAEAKGTVEGLPKTLAAGVDATAADAVRKKLEDAGGVVTVKGV